MSDVLFERSAATLTLIELLRSANEGDIVTYDDMITLTNRDIRKRDRHLLQTALRSLQKHDRIVFGTIVRVGVQRLKPAELTHEGRRRLVKIRRQAVRGGAVMDTAAMQRLTPTQRLEHTATRGVLASVAQTTKPEAQKARVRANPDPQVSR